MDYTEAAVAHFGVPANHICVESEEYHGNHQYNRCVGQDSNSAYHEYKSEMLSLHATSSPTSLDESGSNDPATEIEVALGHGPRSAQAEDKELTAHHICIKKKMKNVKFNKPFKV
jgi:hypothetical protein